jgi:tRNA(Ile)-lysidine synthase
LPVATTGAATAEIAPEYSLAIPGEIPAPIFALLLRIETTGTYEGQNATLRNWKPGDRVRLRYSSGPSKVKEVLERLRITGSSRAHWPVLEIDGRIAWMRGVEVEPTPGISIEATNLETTVEPSPWQATEKART